MTFSEAEALYYEKRYKGYIDALNERYKASGHAERCKSIDDLLKGSKTRPEEFILQIGSLKDGTCDKTTLNECLIDYIQQLKEWDNKHGNHMHLLNFAVHFDETTPHAHFRRVWDYEDKYGNLRINQEQALKAAGIERPDLSKPEGRYNNRKMTFDKMAREMWYEILKKHGLEIETNPLPRKKNQITEKFIESQISDKVKKAEELNQEVSQLETKLKKLNKQIQWTKELRDKQQDLVK